MALAHRALTLLSLAAACSLASAPARGALVTIDFEGLKGMSFQPSPQVERFAELSDFYLASDGLLLTSTAGFVALVELGEGHAPSGVNGIGGVDDGGRLTYSADHPIVGTFFNPLNPIEPAATASIAVRADHWGEGEPLLLLAYDIEGSLLGSDTAIDLDGAALLVEAEGIHRFVFIGSDRFGGSALDDIAFAPLSVIPEPAAALLLPALTVLARRRR